MLLLGGELLSSPATTMSGFLLPSKSASATECAAGSEVACGTPNPSLPSPHKIATDGIVDEVWSPKLATTTSVLPSASRSPATSWIG